MSKVILSTLVAVLFCAAGSAKAEQGISSSTLSSMGLSNMTVMSDQDALAVRGMGFKPSRHSNGCKNCGPRGSKSPSSMAFGNSSAAIDIKDGGAQSENGYLAAGPYGASGENFSEAGSTITNVETVNVGGVVSSVTTVCTTRVWAGGNSSAISF